MKLYFNIYLELAMLPLDIILCGYFWRKYGDKTRANYEFRVLTLLVTLGNLFDIIDAIVVSLGPAVPVLLKYSHNSLTYLIATAGSYQFVRYVSSYAGRKVTGSTGAIINKTLVGIYIVILIQNLATGTVFYYGPDGHLVTGALYTLIVYVYPLYYILYGGIFILSHSSSYRSSMKVALFVTFIFTVGMYFVQMFLDRHLLVTFFAASLALFVLFLTLETPDYVQLMKTMEELSISRRELESAGLRATEMSRAKSRFLAQMSNEIRTPVNAIMGYSNLILADTKEDSTREYSQRVKISAKRLLTFFENVLNYISEESDENGPRRLPSMAELIDQTDESIFIEDENISRRAISEASNIRILVVDDAELNIDLMVRILRPIGFTVDTAANGRQAILQIRKFHYDLIFMDHLMPVMDGIAALRQIREEKLCENTPIIMLTANAVSGEEEKYLDMGFAAYLTKPFKEDAIRDLLKSFLPLSESQWRGDAGISEWEELQENLPTVRVADAREYLLHDIVLYKKLLKAYADNEVGADLITALRNGEDERCRAMIRSQHDMAKMLGAENLEKETSRLEILLNKKEYDLMRERIGAFVSEKNILAQQIRAL